MNEPKGCPTPGACSCLSDMEAKDYVAIPRPQYEALVALQAQAWEIERLETRVKELEGQLQLHKTIEEGQWDGIWDEE